MTPKLSDPPHAGHQLGQLAAATAAAHQAVTEHQAAAVAAAAEQLLAGRETKAQRRHDRLAAIEERNKHAAHSAEQHAS